MPRITRLSQRRSDDKQKEKGQEEGRSDRRSEVEDNDKDRKEKDSEDGTDGEESDVEEDVEEGEGSKAENWKMRRRERGEGRGIVRVSRGNRWRKRDGLILLECSPDMRGVEIVRLMI